jgi:hypothetical protein
MKTRTKPDRRGGTEHWDDRDVDELRKRFVRMFHRVPDDRDLRRFRRGHAALVLRLPMRSRRTVAGMIASV